MSRSARGEIVAIVLRGSDLALAERRAEPEHQHNPTLGTHTTSLSRLIALDPSPSNSLHNARRSVVRPHHRLRSRLPDSVRQCQTAFAAGTWAIRVIAPRSPVQSRTEPRQIPYWAAANLRETAERRSGGGINLIRMEAIPASVCDPAPRCAVCNDTIGVYEPALVVDDGLPRRTSLAREPLLRNGQAILMHADCAQEAAG